MRSYHLLTEAELSAEQQKLLSLLSDEDLESIVSELGEAESGRFAYDPLKRSTSAPQPTKQAQPRPQQPKPQPKADSNRKAEIKQTVDTLKPKEKSALVKAAKTELKQRETKPKEVKPAQAGTLKKIIKNLALAALAATVIGGMFGGSDTTPSGADVAQQPAVATQQVQDQSVVKPFKYGDGATYYTLSAKPSSKDSSVIIYLGKRDGKSGVSYAIYAVDLNSGMGVNIAPGVKTDFESYEYDDAKKEFSKNIPLGDKYDLVPGSTQYKRYVLLKNKLAGI